MQNTNGLEQSKVSRAPLVRVNGSMTVFLPFGLGVAFPQHWTNGRTTIHVYGNCQHCEGHRVEIRDVTAHIAVVKLASGIERCILLLPPKASQDLVDSIQTQKLAGKPVKLRLRRNKSCQRSQIDLSVEKYLPKNDQRPMKSFVTDCLIQVLWERMYGTQYEDSISEAERTFVRLI